MANLRTKLIHWLGGITIDEADTRTQNDFDAGVTFAFHRVLNVMQANHGKEDWGEQVYSYVNQRLNRHE